MIIRKIIINEVLCFCVNVRETMNRDSMVMVISGYFEIDELSVYKEILTSNICIKKIVDDSGCRYSVKRKSPNLSEKISKDIVGIFDLIDNVNSESITLFVASNIRRIPPIGDQNTNMASIHSAIILLRKNINVINEAIIPLIDNTNNIIDTTNKDISPNICDHISADIPIDNQMKSGNSNNNHPISYASIVRNTILDDGFTLITSTKKLKKSQVKDSLIPNKEIVNIRRKGVIIGKNSSEAFGKTPPRRYHLFLSRLNNDVTADDITSYICKEFDITSKECSVEKIITSHHFVSSFKVSLMINNVQDVYNCERWPSSILIKRFFNKANHDNNVNVNSNL